MLLLPLPLLRLLPLLLLLLLLLLPFVTTRADEEAARAMVYKLQNVGRDVRSTPMQWSYEGKKLDCAVKHMSWVPPWVRPRGARGAPPRAPQVAHAA